MQDNHGQIIINIVEPPCKLVTMMKSMTNIVKLRRRNLKACQKLGEAGLTANKFSYYAFTALKHGKKQDKHHDFW